MLKRVEQKRHHNFKVTNHLPGYGNIQNKILESVEEETVVNEVIGDILDTASLVNFKAKKKTWTVSNRWTKSTFSRSYY